MKYPRITCPRCNRQVCAKDYRYAIHSITEASGIQCRMSLQRLPAQGVSPASFETRAAIVADLAWQVQDADPLLVWDALTAMPANELQRLMMVALAGIPTDKKVDEIFAWIHKLPIAQRESA